jgi:hypothetical protein
MGLTQLKRKLRELKRLEKRIRCGQDAARQTLVWNRFFSTGRANDPTVKYPLDALLKMDRPTRKGVVEEYLYNVYYQAYRDSGQVGDLYHPDLLAAFGLHRTASLDDIRSRFRELAKKYHPDLGGDHEKMIQLLETYRQLTGPSMSNDGRVGD